MSMLLGVQADADRYHIECAAHPDYYGAQAIQQLLIAELNGHSYGTNFDAWYNGLPKDREGNPMTALYSDMDLGGYESCGACLGLLSDPPQTNPVTGWSATSAKG